MIGRTEEQDANQQEATLVKSYDEVIIPEDDNCRVC
jgi:hypothetical protein